MATARTTCCDFRPMGSSSEKSGGRATAMENSTRPTASSWMPGVRTPSLSLRIVGTGACRLSPWTARIFTRSSKSRSFACRVTSIRKAHGWSVRTSTARFAFSTLSTRWLCNWETAVLSTARLARAESNRAANSLRGSSSRRTRRFSFTTATFWLPNGCPSAASPCCAASESSRSTSPLRGRQSHHSGFAARPGISLAAEYGPDHLACQALIEPPQPLNYTEEHVPLMSSEGVTEVLEEVAPVATRGKEISDGSFQSGCNVARITDYENVSIMRSTHTCDPSSHDQDVRTAITFKRETCPKPGTP